MLKAGDRIGPYALIRHLGQGGFGTVWLAERRGKLATTEVALKFLHDPELDPEDPALKREVKLWKQVSGHPNIIPLIEADLYGSQVIIVSEYAQGGSLKDWLKRHGGSAPSVEQAIKLTLGILKGLQHLHSKRIVHRDLKPQNVLLQYETPRLIDFGLARALETSTMSTKIVGTSAYMAPERFSSDKERSEQSDIWSAGVILYQLLSGRLPFPQKEQIKQMSAIVHAPPDPLPDSISENIQQIVFTALEKGLEQRYKSAEEMQDALQQLTPQPKLKSVSEVRLNEQIGSYKITKLLGKSSFSTLWLAEQKRIFITTQVVVRTLSKLCNYEAVRQAVEDWAKIPSHTNLVFIMDVSIYNDTPTFVSEFVTGGSLKSWLEKNRKAPTVEAAVSIVDGILAGLEQLHSVDVVHQNLKPSNILLQGEVAKIADFGLSGFSSTKNAELLVYMPPEAFEGENGKSVDLWATSVIFYQLLTGKVPFPYDYSETKLIGTISNTETPKLPESIPPTIAAFVYRSLQKDRTKRFESATQMRKWLNKASQAPKIPKLEPKPSQLVSTKDRKIEIKEVSFLTLKLDQKGSEVSRESRKANLFFENLADGVSLELVEVPGGTFLMGSKDGLEKEMPQHQVNVPPFYMSRYQITQAQWKVVMGTDPSFFKGEWLPVEQVSWKDAKEFCKRLSAKTGIEYRLPTEAEWEYAARSATTTAFSFGETITPKFVNYNGEYPYGQAAKGEYRKKTVEVGSLGLPNQFGLCDMHGNVWEWCEDTWHSNYRGAPIDGSAWLQNGSPNVKVLRGGSWSSHASYCQSSRRHLNILDNRDYITGFRIAVSAVQII